MISLREFVKTNKYLIAAHRGASAECLENTMPAFLSAINVGADMIETDIHYTKDSVIVVHHNKLISSIKANIYDLNYNEFKDISISSTDEFKNLKIPRLSELLELAKDKVYLNIEIKKPQSNDFINYIDKLVSEIEKYSNPEQVILASYYYDMLAYIKNRFPHINTAGIRIPRHTLMPEELKTKLNIDAYICSLSGINKRITESAKISEVFLGVYSVDNQKQLDKALRYNAMALGTNNPKEIVKLLNHTSNR